jgi:hypothetical protein
MSYIQEILEQMKPLGIPEPSPGDRQQYLTHLVRIVANVQGFPEESYNALSKGCQEWHGRQVSRAKHNEELEDPETNMAKKTPKKKAPKAPKEKATKPKAAKPAKKAAPKEAEPKTRKPRERAGVVKRGKGYYFMMTFAKDKKGLDHIQIREIMRKQGHEISEKSAQAMWYNGRMLLTALRDAGLYEHSGAVSCSKAVK